jgi:DNA-directed RNA polymerase II subunit RPB9
MATPQSTASDDVPKTTNNLEQITFRFCSECSNMLYPKEDEDAHKLMFTCRTCQYTEEATSSCVFRHVLNSAAGETAGVTQDVGSDPTVCGPVSSHPSNVHDIVSTSTTATATLVTAPPAPPAPPAAHVDTTLALCLRCGVTLLHCNRCEDPATVGEYNDYVRRNPDFAVDRCICYIRFTNHWNMMDEEAQALYVDRFSAYSGVNIPHSSEDTITQYLPMEITLDPEADPPEALGMEPSSYDMHNALD